MRGEKLRTKPSSPHTRNLVSFKIRVTRLKGGTDQNQWVAKNQGGYRKTEKNFQPVGGKAWSRSENKGKKKKTFTSDRTGTKNIGGPRPCPCKAGNTKATQRGNNPGQRVWAGGKHEGRD